MRFPGKLVTIALVLIPAVCAATPTSWAATLTNLFTFPADASEGCYPNGTLLRDAAGALYGTTGGCPITLIDTLFKLTPPPAGQTKWGFSVLHSFGGGSDGYSPNPNLVMDRNGALYGTAFDYGDFLQGVVFRLDPPAAGQTQWTETVLHAFDYNFAYQIGDGSRPGAGLIMDANGSLYGTTIYGGTLDDPYAIGFGTVFRVTPPAAGQTQWNETVLYRFNGGEDGERPSSPLTIDGMGALYGTTFTGGKQLCAEADGSLGGCGTVFKLTPPAPGKTDWTKTTLHEFTGIDGGLPVGQLLIGNSGVIYGATVEGGNGQCEDGLGHLIGCGAIFELIPPAPGKTAWTEKVIYNFSGIPDGTAPEGGVIQDKAGNLYGTTIGGGTGNVCVDRFFRIVGCGTEFKLSPPAPGQTAWTETVLYNFQDSNDGWKPVGELASDGAGKFFGVSSLGTSSNFGAIFEINSLNPSPTPTRKVTPTPNATRTPTPSPTGTATRIATNTPTSTATRTPTPTVTRKPTSTPTATRKPTSTPTATRKPTSTPTATRKPTSTPTATRKPTATPTATRKPTFTPTATRKPTATPTATRKPTSTPKPSATPTPKPGTPAILGIPGTILVGGGFQINGTGFTGGSVVNFFVATAAGPVNAGPLTPTTRTVTRLNVAVPPTVSLGQGFVSVQVVNTDRSFLSSNVAHALLLGLPAAGIPSVTKINGVSLAATSVDPSFATDNVETVVAQGATVKLGGSGFDTVNGVAIDLFCACPGSKVGPFFLSPGNSGLTATLLSFKLPAKGAPNSPPPGPGSFVVSNAGAARAFLSKSNAVSVPIAQKVAVTSVTQAGNTITVNGSGFSSLTVINFFNKSAAGVANLGGLNSAGKAKIPLRFINSNQFTFTKPLGAAPGASYVQALNPPFVPFSSSGNAPGGTLMLR